MVRVLTVLALVTCCSLVVADEPGTITFVESVPLETEAHLDLPDVPNAPGVWLDLVQGAQHSLDIFSFYVSPDPDGEGPLREVLDAAEDRAHEGVDVRLLTDAKFYKTYPETHDRWLERDHLDARLLDCGQAWGGGVLHAKGMIVDDDTFFLGSQNWDWRALEHIHEFGVVVVQQDLAADMERLFELDWTYAGGQAPVVAREVSHEPAFSPARQLILPGGGTCDAVLAASPPQALPEGMPWDLPLLIDQIDQAQERVRLQMLSYNPGDRDGGYWTALDGALRRAAARGCEVQVILANWAKRHYMVPHLKSLTVMPHIEVRFTNVPPWSGGFIPFGRVEHAKYVTCDGQALWVGTANGSRDYFHQSRNISLFLRGAGTCDTADRFFEASWDSPYAETVDPCAEYEPPRRQ